MWFVWRLQKRAPRLLAMCVCLSLVWLSWGTSGCDPVATPEGATEHKQSDASADQAPADREAPAPHAAPTGCHPLAQGKEIGDCVLPFPSSYYLVKDDQTNTGYRVAYPKGVLPSSARTEDETPMDTKPLNARDGFSPATPILVLFPERVDPAGLIKSTEIAKSIQPDSPVQLIEFGSKTRIPLFAEVDQSIKKDTDPQVLLIRPAIRLKPNQRYLVVLRTSLQSTAGKPLTIPDAYRRLAAGEPPKTPAEAAFAPMLQESLQEAKDAGLKADEILMAWDFRTASDKPLLDQMISMRDQMLQQVGEKGPEYKITNVFNFTKEQKPDIMRIVQGTYQVPSFLDKDTPGSTLLLDDKGNPKVRGMGEFVFQLHIPRCVEERNKPVAIMQFGHGLFGGAEGEMDSGYQRSLINRLCMVQIGHNWIGLAHDDQGYVGAEILPDMNNVARLVNRLQQAHVNAIALTRLVLRRLTQEKALEVNGKPSIDGKEIYYLGISNGAIQGSALMALNPDITKGVLNVGGGPWNMMMSRSGNFSALFVAMQVFYKNAAERQLLLALVQSYFDVVDPITYAPYLLKDPKRFDVPAKQLIIQEAIGDAQVPNVATRTWVRTMGIPALKSLFEPVFGLEEKDGPLDTAAYTQFGPRLEPYPADQNVPPKSNAAHEAARRTEGAMKQMETFFQPNGTIQHFCDGPCDPK